MTPWLHATVLALVVGSSTAVLPPGGWPTGTIQPYDAGPRPLMSAVGATSPGALRRPLPPLGLSAPTHGPAHRRAPGTAGPGPSVSPSRTASAPLPEHEPRNSPPPSHPADSAWAHGPHRASPSPSLAPAPSAATPSRAGSRAGEGRERPGRREEPPPEDDDPTDVTGDSTDSTGSGTDDGDLTAVSAPPRATAAAAAPRGAAQTAAKVFILPLGTGLVLIGLGIGLALFALRLRRG
ncbi:hypothetical protein [Streptomyces griseorubiginosus]|uniref:hypothetical protein n=1 Tax=Streptomyces griseorubiginosus TaxID=67304 RepID=UPI00114032CE|nr:hypothetical protein [Streptomyces griseorubiginosus]